MKATDTPGSAEMAASIWRRMTSDWWMDVGSWLILDSMFSLSLDDVALAGERFISGLCKHWFKRNTSMYGGRPQACLFLGGGA